MLASLGAVAACDDQPGPIETGVPVAVGVELRLTEGVDTFKVPGRLDVEFRRALEGAAPVDAGSVLLPARSRRTVEEVVVPRFRGTLLVRERTASPDLPFLTGVSDPFVPSADLVVEIPLVLCSPPDTVADEEGIPRPVVDPDCPA